MASNPGISQGKLLRVLGSVSVTDYSDLNVTASYLTDAGISVSFDSEAVTFIPTMTGAVPSLEPLQMVTITINLVKTISLADDYKTQMQDDCLLGEVVVRTDSETLSSYTFTNCAIMNVGELSFNGRDAGYSVTIRGYYPVNNDIWS